MKRSEMIEVLQEWIMRCDYGYEFVDHANGIIKFLESQGMLPPAYKKAVLADNGFGFNNNFYVQTFVNEWEPEITQETVDQALEHIGRKGVRGEMEITE